MRRAYSDKLNVYDAARERVAFIFREFPRIYVSFSGGKDSGVMLNLMIQHMREHGITRKIGVMILDNEANYGASLDFMHDIIGSNLDLLDVYWCCMPNSLPCTVSAYEVDWQCWGEADKARWIRPMPDAPYVVNIDNHPFGEWFRPNMNYDEFWDNFAEWYGRGERTANLIGIRASESLNRYRAIMNDRKETWLGKAWTKRNVANVYNCYPIYDWRCEDVWTANARNGWKYNALYELFYKAGVPASKMRVASPFMSESKGSLGLYRVIDPIVWAKLCARVQGANFIATYGRQLTYRSVTLPAGHTWKSFCKFLLDTLPASVAENFRKRFIQSLRVWGRMGRGLPDAIIADLEANGIKHRINGLTAHGNGTLRRVAMFPIPDHLDMVRAHPSMVASWKRLTMTILKNDHVCKYLGLQPTREQQLRQRAIQDKYRALGRTGTMEREPTDSHAECVAGDMS